MRLITLMVVLMACEEKSERVQLPWKPHVIKELQRGPFTIKIPAGWRDLSESQSEKLKAAAVIPGQHTITTESATGDAYVPLIQLNAMDGAPRVACADFQAELEQTRTLVSVERARAGAHDACMFRTRPKQTPDRVARGVVVFVPKGQVVVNCIYKDDDKASDEACSAVLNQMSVVILVTLPGP